MMRMQMDLKINQPQLRPLLSMNLLVPNKVWLGGGALRTLFGQSEKVSDFDVFFNAQDLVQPTEKILVSRGFKEVFRCPAGKLTTFKKKGASPVKVQLITEKFYSSAEDMLDTFDITACRHAYDGETLSTFYSSIRDVKRKRINLHRVQYPNATLKRIAKYSSKGYRLTNEATEFFTQFIYNAGADGVDVDGMWRFYVD